MTKLPQVTNWTGGTGHLADAILLPYWPDLTLQMPYCSPIALAGSYLADAILLPYWPDLLEVGHGVLGGGGGGGVGQEQEGESRRRSRRSEWSRRSRRSKRKNRRILTRFNEIGFKSGISGTFCSVPNYENRAKKK